METLTHFVKEVPYLTELVPVKSWGKDFFDKVNIVLFVTTPLLLKLVALPYSKGIGIH